MADPIGSVQAIGYRQADMAEPIGSLKATGYRQAAMAKPIVSVQAIGYRQTAMALLKGTHCNFYFQIPYTRSCWKVQLLRWDRWKELLSARRSH